MFQRRVVRSHQGKQKVGHHRLCRAGRAIVAFDRNAKAGIRHGAAKDAFRAGLDQRFALHRRNGLGTKPPGAGDMEWLGDSGLEYTPRRDGGFPRGRRASLRRGRDWPQFVQLSVNLL